MCSEVLSHLVFQAESNRSITAIPFGRGSHNINHLLFTDDSLLFCQANSLKWSRLIHLLEKYEATSGQLLNKDKTSIYFSANTHREVRKNILQISWVRAIGTFEKYHGLPTIVGANKAESFHNLLDKV